MNAPNCAGHRLRAILFSCLLLFSTACSTLDTSRAAQVDRQALWVVLPFANHTETPLAGNRAEAITEALMRAQGIGHVKRHPQLGQHEALFDNAGERRLQEDALAWAKAQGARYAVSGTVYEWRYKVGVDGEPAAGVTLQIVDVASGETLWSGSGGKSGWSREALSAVAQQLIRDLLSSALAGAR
jgi:TolB-like protein